MANSNKSTFRKISNWLHLWLGLLSGVVVFVVCLTAAIWVFRDEIDFLFTPGQSISGGEGYPMKPSELLKELSKVKSDLPLDGESGLYSIDYRGPTRSALVSYISSRDEKFHDLFVDPYNAKILHERHEDNITKFHDFLRAGHRFFWLPRPFGSYFVGANCLIFLITLITGLIWWYPNKWNKSTRNKSFKIKWNANWKRFNIDLHNVLGFYTIIFTFILTVTGIVYTFRWFDNSYHWLVTGGADRIEVPKIGVSDSTLVSSTFQHPDDEIWNQFIHEGNLKLRYPHEKEDVFILYINPTTGHNDLTKWYAFDQKSLKITGESYKPEEYSLGQKIYKANFDIHVGTIGGLTTKIIASIASLIGASLPITGFIIWYNRKWGKKKKRKPVLKT